MTTFTSSDEQLIERVRKAQRYRRPIGAICLLLGLIGIGLVVYWVHDLHTKSAAVFEAFAYSPHPTTQQLAYSFDEARFNTGFNLGFMAAAGLASAAECAVGGFICVLVRNRKDRLLLECWDRHPAAQ